MNYLLLALLWVAFSVSGLYAEDKPPSAFEELKRAQKQVGERTGKRLLSMESQHAKLRPRYWWIRFFDEQAFLKVRAIHIIGPEIIRDIEPSNPFDGGNAEYIITTELLKCDSEKCIAFMEKAAKENKIPLYSLNVRLEKPYPGESNPIWYFEWFDEKENSLGEINISAATSRVTEIIGLKIKDKKFQKVSKKTFSQDVEDTFLGVGADLEEFFTDQRTIDKPE